jgi:ribosomal protection tetracycline resistance protein
VLSRLDAIPQAPAIDGLVCRLEGEIPAGRVHELQQKLPSLTRGEGVLETAFDHYRPMRGPPPSRARTDFNPLDRREYLLRVSRRELAQAGEDR